MRLIALIPIFALLVAGCATETSMASRCRMDGAGPQAGSENECRVVGGSWERRGMMNVLICAVPTSDAGKPCRDTSDCQSFCVAPAGAPAGKRVTGSCSGSYETLGSCISRVCLGRAEIGVCTD